VPDPTPSWFDDEPDRPRRRPSRRVVVTLVAATIPWLVLVVLLLRGTPTEPPRVAATTHPAPDAGADGPSDDPGARGDAAADGAPPAEPVVEGAVSSSAEIGDASAVATAVVRAWLSDAAPDLAVAGIEPDRRAYLEHVTLQRVEVPGPDAAVATLSVVLLVRDDDRYVDAVVRRVAVPLTLSATAVHPGGAPWWLPDELDLDPAAPRLTPTDDPATDDAVHAALTRAGYEDVTIRDIGQGQGELVVATVEATTPAGDPVDGPLWLVGDPSSLTVLGTHPDGAAPDVADEDGQDEGARP
jgi:hypothetical protein